MKKRIIIICYVIIAVGIVFFYSSCKDSRNTQKTGNVENNSTEKSETISAKPEEPAQKQDEAPTVEIPLEKQQLIGVRTIAAAIQPLQKIIRTTGKIEYDERKLTTINTKVEGWIEKLYFNFTGIYVKKGEPLADIVQPRALGNPTGIHQPCKMGKKDRQQSHGFGKNCLYHTRWNHWI